MVGLLLVLWNLGSTSVIAYFLRTAQRHEAERDDADKRAQDAEQRYKELATIVSGPLTRYNELVIKLQEESRKLEQSDKAVKQLETQFEQYKARALEGGDNTRTSAALLYAEGRVRALTGKLAAIQQFSSLEVDAFWARAPDSSFLGQHNGRIAESIPILMFANQKGGVGKTTVSTNLAAHFQHKAGERVLAIDLDYQGSMSMMMSRQAGLTDEAFRSTVDLIFQKELPDNWRSLSIVALNKKLHYMPCHYSFEKVERSLEYGWLTGEFDDDIRYRLTKVLMLPEIQDNFDRIIIDTPPRFTAGFVNAFCCSTHLFVPTIVDDPSLNAVGHFIEQFSRLSAAVNPQLKLGGIVGVRTTNKQGDSLPSNTIMQARADAADVAARRALKTDNNYFLRDAVIKDYPTLAWAAEEGISYFKEQTTRAMFDNLGKRISEIAPRKKR